MSHKALPARPNLAQYKKQAKELLKAYGSGDDTAISRFRDHHPRGRRLPAATFQLSDAQWVLAREYGFDSWRALANAIQRAAGGTASEVADAVQLQVPTGREVNLATFLRGDPRMVTATEAEPIRVWDVATGTLVRELGGYSNHAWAMKASADNRTLFVGCRDGSVRVTDLETDSVRQTLSGHRGLVRCLDVSDDQTRAISGGMRDRELRLWDVPSERCLRVFDGHRDGIYCVAFDAAGRRALSGSRDTDVRLWDLERGVCTAVLEGHRYHVHSVAWSADGTKALSCSQEIRLWDIATERCVRSFTGHTETIRSVAWSPNQKLAASAAHDRTVRVWNVETGECVRILSGHSTGVISAVWMSDSRITSCDWNGEVRGWELD